MEEAYKKEAIYGLAELFKIFGDPTRIRILYVMLDTERCVNDIAGLLQMSQSSVSHQLRILKTSKLVKSRREGKSIFTLWMTSMSVRFSAWVWNILWKETKIDILFVLSAENFGMEGKVE